MDDQPAPAPAPSQKKQRGNYYLYYHPHHSLFLFLSFVLLVENRLARLGDLGEVNQDIIHLIQSDMATLHSGLFLGDIYSLTERTLSSFKENGITLNKYTRLFIENLMAIQLACIYLNKDLGASNVHRKYQDHLLGLLFPKSDQAKKDMKKSNLSKGRAGGKYLIALVKRYGIYILLFPEHMQWSLLGSLSMDDFKDSIAQGGLIDVLMDSYNHEHNLYGLYTIYNRIVQGIRFDQDGIPML